MLNLSKNNLGDEGTGVLMEWLKANKSLVSLNLSSNDISSGGFKHLCRALVKNEGLISLDVSTVDGFNRNRISKTNYEDLKQLLIQNKFIENLNLQGIGLGNEGMKAVVGAFCYGFSDEILKDKEPVVQEYGQFI